MEIRPDIRKLMRREIYTLLTISFLIIISFMIIHGLVVTFDPEVTHAEFIKYVWSWVGGFLVVFWIFTPWFQYLWIINLKYTIDDERLVINKGILIKKNVSIPYSAVTDFTLSRSLYERWLEIGTILVQTAGQGAQSGGHEGRLEGLIEFDSLNTQLRSKVKDYRGSNTQQSTPESSTPATEGNVLEAILDEVKKINRNLNN